MGDESRESGIGVVGKQEREALRDRDLQYSALLEVCPDAVVEFDVQARITRTTPQTLALFGLTRIEEALGRSILDFIDPHEHSKATATIERVLAEGAAKNIEHTLIRKDGASFPAEVSDALIRDAAGTPKAIIATIRDIAERKRAEREHEDLLLRLAKRVQELQCLCRVGEAVRQGGTLEEIIQEVVWFIPPALRLPFWSIC